jgi:gas vesicle protein
MEKGEENKVGNLIVQAERAMEEQESLQYDPDNYVSVIAGALKESIDKIEEDNEKIKTLENEVKELEAKNKALEELVYSMNERLLKLEDK